MPNNSKSLWRAVKVAKNINVKTLPKEMYYNNIQIDENNLPDTFAEFFMSKTAKIVNETIINPNVYNGGSKLYVDGVRSQC